MKRLGAIDKVLLFLLVPIWGFWFAISLYNLAHDRIGVLPIVVSAPTIANPYPVVRGFQYEPWGNLKIGDRLLRIGREDLRGVWPIGLFSRVQKEMDPRLRVSIVFDRDGQRHQELVTLFQVPFPWQATPVTVLYTVLAILLIIRAPASRLIRVVFVVLMADAFLEVFYCFAPIGLFAVNYAWAAVAFACMVVVDPLALTAVILIPEHIGSTNAHLPKWPWFFAVARPIECSWMVGISPAPALVYSAFLVDLAFAVALLWVVTRRFLVSDPIGRRQIKWILYGIYMTTVPVRVIVVLTTLWPSMLWLSPLIAIFLGIFPLCAFIAIIRFNLFDIDRLISATAAYSIVLVIVIAGAIALAPHVSLATNRMLGLDTGASQVFVPLMLAILIVPASRVLRPRIERVFFAERYAFETGVDEILRALSGCAAPGEVLALIGERLNTLLRPQCCVVYGCVEGSYSPVFVRGRTIAPNIELRSGIIEALQFRSPTAELMRWPRNIQRLLSASDRAILDSIGAVILLGIAGRESLAALLCLGEKRSGDIYTQTDLALLAAMTDRASAELHRFDEIEIAQQARAMQDALRRYVPQRIAARIVSGQALDAREREISVLFVDIRGFTTYAEDRSASEVFSTIGRYTEAVSQVVLDHGGTVVEFNGDGMMAVFGAPEDLLEKERAATAAGCEIVRVVHSLSLGGGAEQYPLDVGVGIATGTAFVGNIHSLDRLIWSAIGDTPNRAARLQALTRELDAAVAIDAATWKSASDLVANFQRRDGVPLRGRRQAQDVYFLPL